jgi:hypothetical protein
MRVIGFIGPLSLLLGGCAGSPRLAGVRPPDRHVVASSQYPAAVDPSLVGRYPARTKSGGGHFYDDVLEYRVWIHPADGGDDYYRAFASFEPALEFSNGTPGAEEALVLVRQLEWINEPQNGKFERRSGERLTEWRIAWLKGSKRSNQSVARFMERRGTAKSSARPLNEPEGRKRARRSLRTPPSRRSRLEPPLLVAPDHRISTRLSAPAIAARKLR